MRRDGARPAWVTLLLAAALYEAVARSGVFPPALLPTLPKVARTLVAMLRDGTMLEHAATRSTACCSGFGSPSRSGCRSAS